MESNIVYSTLVAEYKRLESEGVRKSPSAQYWIRLANTVSLDKAAVIEGLARFDAFLTDEIDHGGRTHLRRIK